MDAGISYISLLSSGRGDLKEQTRKTASNANFALHLFLLPPQPVPGTCCPEHPQHRPFSPSPWAPPGPFFSHSSTPTGKAPTGTGEVFGEAPLSSDFHGKRAVTPCRQHPTPQPNATWLKHFSCPVCRTHLQGLSLAGDWRGVPRAPFCCLGGARGPLASLHCTRASSGKGSFRSSEWIDTWEVLLLLFIAASLCSD